MRRLQKCFLLILGCLSFILTGVWANSITLEGEKNVIVMDSYPPVDDTNCRVVTQPKGIISAWFYDSDGDSYYYPRENIFYNNYASRKEFGNYFEILGYRYYNGRYFSTFQRCFPGNIINATSKEVWYRYPLPYGEMLISYRLESYKGIEYIVKTYHLNFTSTAYISYFRDVFAFTYNPTHKYQVALYNRLIIDDETYTFNDFYGFCNPEGYRFYEYKLLNSTIYLPIREGRYLFGYLCSTTHISPSVQIFYDMLSCDKSHYRFKKMFNLLGERWFNAGDTFTTKIIWSVVDTSTSKEIFNEIITKEGCLDEKDDFKERYVREGINTQYAFYDPYTLEGLVFANAFNLTYVSSLQYVTAPFYYLSDEDLYFNGININRRDMIYLARKNNITIYSSCDDEQSKILTASIAYHKGGVYIDNYPDADIYLCEDAKDAYFNTFNFTLYGISLVPSSLPWKYFSIVYANKSYPVILNRDENLSTVILHSLRDMVLRINHNPYFKSQGMFVVIFGDESYIEIPQLNGVRGDMIYGMVDSDMYVDLGVGRITAPQYPKEYHVVESAVIMSDYEENRYGGFLNYYNGMLTSLIIRKWLSRGNVEIKRYAERRAVLEDVDAIKEHAQSLRDVASLISAGASIPIKKFIGSMIAIFLVTSEIMEVIHEIDYDKSDLNSLYLVFVENLTSKSFEEISKYDLFVYLGVIGENVFTYPLVSADTLQYEGMFYLDYDNTYYVGKELFSKGAFGIVLMDEKDSKKSQERSGMIFRDIYNGGKSIGIVLRDSANLLLVEKSMLEKIGLTSESLRDAYARAYLGDPSTIIQLKNMPLRRDQRFFYVPDLEYGLLSNDPNYIVIERTYNLSGINDSVFVDVISIPFSTEIKVEFELIKRENNSTYINFTCDGGYEVRESINYQKEIYFYVPIRCMENNKSMQVEGFKITVFYLPDVEILEVRDSSKNIYVVSFSSRDVNTTLSFVPLSSSQVIEIPVTLKRGVNNISISKYENNILGGEYYVVLGNASTLVNISSYSYMWITEVYPNPPNEELEFVEVLYKGNEKNISLTLFENKNHTINVVLKDGFYVFVRNKTLFIEEFDIPSAYYSNIVEVRGMRLNNNGERIGLYVDGMLEDAFTYTSSSCIRREECSVNRYFNKTYYAPPNPFRLMLPKDVRYDENKGGLKIDLLTSEVYSGNKIKLRLVKERCDPRNISVEYALGNYSFEIYSLSFLCSKTLSLIFPPLAGGNYTLRMNATYGNETYYYVFNVTIYDSSTLLCSLDVDVVPHTTEVKKDEYLTFDVYINDKFCKGLVHPLELEHVVRDYEGNVIYHNANLITLECGKKITKRLKFNDNKIKNIAHPLLFLTTSIKNPYCNVVQGSLNSTRSIIYVGELMRDREEKTMSKDSRSSGSFQKSGVMISSQGNAIEKKESSKEDVEILNVVFVGNSVEVYVHNKEMNNMSLYSYITQNGKLVSYYCINNSIKRGWKSNLIESNNETIVLRMCLKDSAKQGKAKLTLKFRGFSSEEWKDIKLDIVIPYLNFTLEKRVDDSLKDEISYKCINNNKFIGFFITSSQPEEIIVYDKRNNINRTYLITGEMLFDATHKVFFVNNTYVECYQPPQGIVDSIVGWFWRLIEKIF